MSYLFIVENNIAKPNTETLLIEPFSTIWERDTSKGKEQAIKEFTFIELMTSKKKSNPYAGYSDTDRFNKLREDIFKDAKWEQDKLVEQALIKVDEFQKEASPTYVYYIDSLETAEKTRKFLKEIDLSERNEKTGNPLYKPRDVTSALIDTERVILTLASLKEKVEQELFETTKTKGNKQINHYEE